MRPETKGRGGFSGVVRRHWLSSDAPLRSGFQPLTLCKSPSECGPISVSICLSETAFA